MFFLRRNLFILYLVLFSWGCESKKAYDIASDKAIADMSSRIASLEQDFNELSADLEKVKKVLNKPGLKTDIRAGVRREIHEGERYKKEIDQWISYLKIRRKKRHRSLFKRKDQENLEEVAQKEVRAYFMEKKLKPIPRNWNDRYRVVIEL